MALNQWYNTDIMTTTITNKSLKYRPGYGFLLTMINNWFEIHTCKRAKACKNIKDVQRRREGNFYMFSNCTVPEFPLYPSSFKHLLYKLTTTVSALAQGCHQAIQGTLVVGKKRKKNLQSYLRNLNICIEIVYAKCWLIDLPFILYRLGLVHW